MKFNSLVDPRKRELVKEAIRRKDASLLIRKKPKAETIRVSGLEVFIPSTPGATMEEALVRAKKEKRVIASNKRLDLALNGSAEWEGIKGVFPCWTGTMTAYEEVGKPFGEVVEYTNDETGLKYLFPVPQKYQGKTDCILVAEHPDYSLEIKGDERIIRAAKVDLIEKFPIESCKWYLTDPKHGIPFGDAADDSDSKARYLYRIEKRVGHIARGHFDLSRTEDHRRYIDLVSNPSMGLGVVVECPVSGDQLPDSGRGSGIATKK